MDLYSAPVEGLRVFPSEVLVQQRLLAGTVHQIFSADDVSDALLMILYGALEVEQWPYLVPIPCQGVRCVLNP